MNTTRICVLAIFTALTSSSLWAQQKYSLAYKPKYGDTVVQTLSIETQTKVTHSAGYTISNSTITYEFDLVTNLIADTGYSITYIYRKLSSNTQTDQVYNGAKSSSKLNISSEDDPEDIEATEDDNKIKTYKYYRLLVGQSYTVYAKSDNSVLRLSGLKELRRKILKEIRENWKGNANYDQFKNTVESTMSDESIINNFKNSMGFYPTESISIGSKWKFQNQVAPGQGVEGTSTYKFKKLLNDSTAEISVEMPFQMQNAASTTPWKGVTTGTLEMDIRTGEVKFYKSVLTMKGKAGQANGKPVKMTSNSTTIYTTHYKKP